MNRKQIISRMERIMEIALHYANPEVKEPELSDFHYIFLIAENVRDELKREIIEYE